MTVNVHKNFMKGEKLNDNLDNSASFEVRAEGNYSHSIETRAAVPGTSFTMSV